MSTPSLFDAPGPEPEPQAVARVTDPGTSWAAAKSVENLRPRQQAVLDCLGVLGGAGSDEEIAATYNDFVRSGRWPKQSPSGLRTRRSELVELKLVEDSGRRGLTASNRHTIVWQLT